jgi:hypothetical protein
MGGGARGSTRLLFLFPKNSVLFSDCSPLLVTTHFPEKNVSQLFFYVVVFLRYHSDVNI